MFRKLRKLYFKIYHLFKLLGIFILVFGIKRNVYAIEVNKYYIKDGIFQESYQYIKKGGTESGTITENYQNSGAIYATARTWSRYNLVFNNLTVQEGDKITIVYKRPTVFTGGYDTYASAGIIKITETEETISYINGTTREEQFKTYEYQVLENCNIELYFTNLAYSTAYQNYGVYIKDFIVTSQEDTPEKNEVYSSFLEIYKDRLIYLTEGFTTNPYLIAMIGIIISFIVLELLLKIINIGRNRRR